MLFPETGHLPVICFQLQVLFFPVFIAPCRDAVAFGGELLSSAGFPFVFVREFVQTGGEFVNLCLFRVLFAPQTRQFVAELPAGLLQSGGVGLRDPLFIR